MRIRLRTVDCEGGPTLTGPVEWRRPGPATWTWNPRVTGHSSEMEGSPMEWLANHETSICTSGTPKSFPRTPPPLPPGSLVRAVEAFHERAAPNPGCTIGHHRHDSLPRPSRSHCETLSARPLRLLCNVLTQEAAAACPPRNPLLPRRLRRRLRIFASAAFPIPRLHGTPCAPFADGLRRLVLLFC